MAATSRDTGPQQHPCGQAAGRLKQIGEAAERASGPSATTRRPA